MSGDAARCANCGAAVGGRYCGECGQRLEAPVHSLWHFTQVAAEDLTHADSRLWRTFWALLFRPGYLTREFLAGRRVRYLPPVRLYLVLSVAFFVWASATQEGGEIVQFDRNDGPATAVVKQATETTADALRKALPPAPAAGETPQARAERECRDLHYEGPWQHAAEPRLRRVCAQAVLDHGRALKGAFLHNLPRAMFAFLPLLAGAMKLLYWRPRHYYVEHLLLLVHNHAFVFLILPLAWLLGLAVPPAARWLHGLAWVYMAWYVYRSMRVAYGQGRWVTGGKLLLMSFVYLVCGALMVALTTVFSALTLT